MIRQYFTLFQVANELQSLIGCQLLECFSQEKNSLIMNFSDGVNEYFVQYYGEPNKASMFLRSNYSRARKNTIDLFDTISGEVLQSVHLHGNDRIIEFDFINTKLFAFLFGGAGSNIIAVRNDNIIIEALKSGNIQIGQKLEFSTPGLQPLSSFPQDSKLIDVLAKCNLNIGKYYVQEVLSRTDFKPDTRLNDLSSYDSENILNEVNKLIDELKSSSEFIIYDTGEGLLLSLIPLSSYTNVFGKYNSISEGILKKIVNDIKTKTFGSLYKEITSKLERQKIRLTKNIERIKDEIPVIERAKKYKLFADLLLSHPQKKMKFGKEIELTDYNGNDIKVPIDEKLNLLENATKYFDKHRNNNEELKIRKKRQPELELRLLKIENALKLVNEADTFYELEKVSKKLKELTGIRMTEDNNDISTKFREFDLGEGFILYVGKNAANNDELTMKFAKPNDIWFHSRGSGGSHAVLRLNKDQKAPKNIIKKAAAIVAYYSQARNAKYTPVAYTFKKNVRKPKGANTGSVVITREEVVMVEPGLPE